MAGTIPLDRLIARYHFVDFDRPVADATSGAGTKPLCWRRSEERRQRLRRSSSICPNTHNVTPS
jgi:hypothetical protein